MVAAAPRPLAVDVDHETDAFADDLSDADDDPSRLSAALRRWLTRTP